MAQWCNPLRPPVACVYSASTRSRTILVRVDSDNGIYLLRGGTQLMDRLFNWIKTNWTEESNVGKAKLGAIAALIFLLIASVLPEAERQVEVQSQVESDQDAARQAGETYAQYEARVAELEKEKQTGAKEAAAAYQGYEARIAELEHEREALEKKMSDAGSMDSATEEASAAYRDYEARVSALEREKRDLAEQMNKLEAGGDAAREAAEAYRQYEARVAELEKETQTGQKEAAATYSTYETRIAELERENKALNDQLADKDQRIAELEQGTGATGQIAPSTETMELRLQLEAMRTTLDQMLKKLGGPAGEAE